MSKGKVLSIVIIACCCSILFILFWYFQPTGMKINTIIELENKNVKTIEDILSDYVHIYSKKVSHSFSIQRVDYSKNHIEVWYNDFSKEKPYLISINIIKIGEKWVVEELREEGRDTKLAGEQLVTSFWEYDVDDIMKMHGIDSDDIIFYHARGSVYINIRTRSEIIIANAKSGYSETKPIQDNPAITSAPSE